jgi:hypothetical protein
VVVDEVDDASLDHPTPSKAASMAASRSAIRRRRASGCVRRHAAARSASVGGPGVERYCQGIGVDDSVSAGGAKQRETAPGDVIVTLRFLFAPDDLAAIRYESIQLSEEPLSENPDPTGPAPQSLHLRFTLTGTTRPQVRAPFGGRIQFLPSPLDTRPPPELDDIELTPTSLGGLRRLGTLLFVADADAATELTTALPDAPIRPNRMWVGPVEVTTDFLLTTLPLLQRGRLRSGPTTYNTDHADWHRAAITEFLRGNYNPEVELGDAAAQNGRDDYLLAMPEAAAGGGTYDLDISVAHHRNTPQDGRSRDFDDRAPLGVTSTSPHHSSNGWLPARWFLTSVPWHDADDADMSYDTLTGPATNTTRYYPLVCTRTWQIIDNCSVHFPDQVIDVDFTGTQNLPTMSTTLPSHGVVFVPIVDNPTPGAALPITVAFRPRGTATSSELTDEQYTMTWLDGATPDSWRTRGAVVPLQFPYFGMSPVHIILRRRMSDAVLVEPTMSECHYWACTFLSLRRTIRTLVDNRICGGRLNAERRTTQQTTDLMHAAFGAASQLPNTLRNDSPNPRTQEPKVTVLLLRPFLEAFFPESPPGHATCTRSLGATAYDLWQTLLEPMEQGSHRADYPDDCVGRGAPGAAVALGLASFHVNIVRATGETDADWRDRMVDAMATGLQPGAILQKWSELAYFEALVDRVALSSPASASGHSPMFARYTAAPENLQAPAMEIYDQGGSQIYATRNDNGTRNLNNRWLSETQIDVWVAANWIE